MDRETAKELIGCKVHIITFHRLNYTGKVLSATKDSFEIIDKFGQRVSFSYPAILMCEEVLIR